MKAKLTIGVILVLAQFFCAGCATYDAYHARFREPKYLVTDKFYSEAPQKIAFLPFAGPTDKKKDLEKGEMCRKIFYQQMSISDFEHIGLHKTDDYVLSSDKNGRENIFKQLFGFVRKLDVVGMTDLLGVPAVLDKNTIDYFAYTNLVHLTKTKLGAKACMLGYTRSYGRLYAVVLSSLGISTRLEMRSTDTGSLLWRGEAMERNYEVPLTLNILDIPYELIGIWKNSRGLAMDMLAYGVYRDLANTVPYVSEPKKVFVKATAKEAPLFKKPTMWMLWKSGSLTQGAMIPFLMEQDGWYKGLINGNEPVWIFRRYAVLVDEAGKEIKNSNGG